MASPTTARPRQSRASRATGQAAKPTAKPSETPKVQPKPEIIVEAVPVTYHRPTVKFPDGKTVICAHKYLHETEKAAAACGRKIAALGAFVK
jgi:hypothetical protein